MHLNGIMRKFFSLSLIFYFALSSNAQHINELTNNVVKIFTKTHPTVINVEWIFLDSNFIAVFKEKGYSYEKTYNKTGKLIRTKLEIDASFLPKSSSDFVARYYTKNNIYKAFKLFDDFSNIVYFIEIDSNQLSFDINGSFLKLESTKKLK